MLLKEIIHPSPNFDRRSAQSPLDLVIIHYTGMASAEAALARLCDPVFKVSAHYLISKSGELYELVDPAQRAWHAGVSFWQGERDINSRSIGIELDNFGHQYGLEPFPSSQMDTLLALLSELTQAYAIPRHRIIGHSDVAPLRKQDPGEMFPWESLASKGFGLWPQQSPAAAFASPPTIAEMQGALSDIGYDCPQTGIWDETCQKICLAFQRHFTPQELTGHFTALTCAMIDNIAAQTKFFG